MPRRTFVSEAADPGPDQFEDDYGDDDPAEIEADDGFDEGAFDVEDAENPNDDDAVSAIIHEALTVAAKKLRPLVNGRQWTTRPNTSKGSSKGSSRGGHASGAASSSTPSAPF